MYYRKNMESFSEGYKQFSFSRYICNFCFNWYVFSMFESQKYIRREIMRQKILMCIMCISIIVLFSSCVFAASTNASTPSLVTKISSAFTKIQGYLKKLKKY